ncbi:MAG: hypothetical protein IJ387_06235, partial [Thermoguttaceae bacterium]|nr:hypothetical protein [Thermoguttaceae bacterium]
EVLGYEPFTPWPGNPEHMPDSRDWHFKRRDGEPGSIPYMNRVLGFSPRLYRSEEDYLRDLF